jgi:hypothetical protein
MTSMCMPMRVDESASGPADLKARFSCSETLALTCDRSGRLALILTTHGETYPVQDGASHQTASLTARPVTIRLVLVRTAVGVENAAVDASGRQSSALKIRYFHR